MKITTINSVEISSVCNLRCIYCPAKEQHKHREIGYMERAVFVATIEWIQKFANAGTQREVNLFGVGEPLLNPDIVQLVKWAREHLPYRIPLHLNTNGILLTKEMAIKLKDAGIGSIDVTGHQPKAAAQAIRILTEVEISFRVSFDAILAPNNWAGQVDWFEPRYPNPYPCPWIGRGQVMVMSNGDVTRCCIDAFGNGILGNVMDDDLTEIEVTPFDLCRKCHHTL